MQEVQCPSLNPINECDWRSIKGKVRDFPSENVIRCFDCKLVVHQNDLRESVNYEDGSMHKWSEGYGGNLGAPADDITRRIKKLKTLKTEKKVQTVLDFGCGQGEMIVAMSPFFEVAGLEPELQSRAKCQETGLKVFSSVQEIKKTNEQFDLITLFHVFEHFYSPFEELEMIKEVLKPGGRLLIETPNSSDALLNLFESESFSNFTFWSHHPMLHSRISLEKTLETAGFVVELSEGHQRYGLANHLYWLSQNMPGGHLEWRDFFSAETERNYESDLANLQMSDTLWVVASRGR